MLRSGRAVPYGIGSGLSFTAIDLADIENVRTHGARRVDTVWLCTVCGVSKIRSLFGRLLLMRREVFVGVGEVGVVGHTRRRVIRKRHAIMSVVSGSE